MTRREFTLGLVGASAVAHSPALANATATEAPVDVIVAGGGPAGIAAAIAAARSGASVRLFEAHGALGGIWTSGILGCMISFNKSDTDREITRRLKELGAWRRRRPQVTGRDASNYVYEPEYLKLVCESMCEEAKVDFLLHTSVVDCVREVAGRKLAAVVTESKDGRRVWPAKAFIDCTGDGDLAARAGCGFDFGGPDGSNDQPASLCAVAVSPHREGLRRFVVNDPMNFGADGRPSGNAKDAFHRELVRAGLQPSYSKPTLFEVRDGIYVVMMNHEYGVRVDDARQITRATVAARREILMGSLALGRLGGAWSDFRIVTTAEQLGHRAARRIHGRYTITTDDVVKGAKFDDAIVTSDFAIDVHATTREANRSAGYTSLGVKPKPFQIPLRACRARELDNLYMAGRCISGDFVPMASYRVTGCAVAMGEAVGRAAAKAAR